MKKCHHVLSFFARWKSWKFHRLGPLSMTKPTCEISIITLLFVLILSISKILSIVLPTFVLMAISNVLAHNTEDNSSFTHFPKNFVVHWKCFWLLSINYFSIYMEIAQSIIRFQLTLKAGLTGSEPVTQRKYIIILYTCIEFRNIYL